MRKEHSSRFIFSIFALIGALLVSAWGVNITHADTAESSSAQGGAQLSLAGNGQTILRDARVVAVQGTQITLEAAWGATKMLWTVETTGSTKFYPHGASRDMLKALQKGDYVSITGTLDMTTSRPTVRAAVVRNLSLAERQAGSVAQPTAVPETPAASADVESKVQSGTTSSPSSQANDSLIVSASSTALLVWLWRFLYGDPGALSVR